MSVKRAPIDCVAGSKLARFSWIWIVLLFVVFSWGSWERDLAASAAPLSGPIDGCHPAIAPERPQFVIGYGSLIDAASKQQTVPTSSDNLPVKVQGFERGWFYQSAKSDYDPMTYLGVVENPAAAMNAALFQILGDAEVAIDRLDERERDYCRQRVDPARILRLDGAVAPLEGEVWIYGVQSIHPPNASHPICQSYVDIFLSGCLALEAAYGLDANRRHSFATECIQTTTHWSRHWLNDRRSPRRPHSQPIPVTTIDRLLSTVPASRQSWRRQSSLASPASSAFPANTIKL